MNFQVPFLTLFTILTLSVFKPLSAQEISFPEEKVRSASFELIIHGLEEDEIKGEMRVAVFNSEEKYNKKEEPLYAVVLNVDADSISWSVNELPYGNYAIAVYHDKNTNGKLDTNLLGIPKESYGFSNDARGRFGPASWEDASFRVDAKGVNHRIKIK